MKKRYVALLMALLMLVLCACSNAPVTNNETTGTTDTTDNIGSGVADSIFDDETGSESQDKSFSSSVPVVQIPEDTTGETTDGETVTGQTSEGATGTTNGSTDSSPDTSMTYEAFEALTPTEKRKFQESFSDIEQFFDWYEAVKEKYEKENPPIEIGGGAVTLPT